VPTTSVILVVAAEQAMIAQIDGTRSIRVMLYTSSLGRDGKNCL